MQEAVAPGRGAMAVVLGLENENVRALCEAAANGEVVAPANFNGGGQVVISGAKEAVGRAAALAKERGAKRVFDLPVSAPFHCLLMQPAADGLAKVLAGVAVRPLSVGVVTNVEAEVNLDAGRVKSLLVAQAVRPVRWEESIVKMADLGCLRALEIGPGQALKGMIKRIVSTMEVENFEGPKDLARIMPRFQS
jgi:[acyl-carrier-protein] S-malonyltransferase